MENIEALEKRLWSSADNLRANSPYASNEYFLPVMGIVFLRHAYSRYLAVKDGIETSLPKRSGKIRPLTKERGRNNFPNYASQLQVAFVRSQIPKILK